MNESIDALIKSFLSLFRLSILVRIALPFLLSFLFALFLIISFWNFGISSLESFLMSLDWLVRWIDFMLSWTQWPAIQLIGFISMFLFVLIIVPLIYFIYLILTSLFLVPLLLKVILKKEFPDLELRGRGRLAPSIKNSLVATFYFVVGFTAGLPLFLLPGGQIVWPLFLNAFVSKIVFPYDVLQDVASDEEINDILKNENDKFWSLGLTSGIFFYIPFLNLLTPSLIGLSYIYLSLNLLQKRRQTAASRVNG
jgi:CysZ protein